ncbi:hypothetical protein N0B44_12540 [Roseibacterium beibuensis]|uniref:Uncharacterized protein n=1 Tax=[Roseibacterium] beibuensis TaxID=1193142 RepID=A0ABP9L7N7_9RHOB|nr:hypothetical protein [Roseibacterium beibuensis]MCS6623742.1 hypothetical protein [Roseibacterium beibuensis]
MSPAGGWDFVNLHWMCGAMQTGAIEVNQAQARIVRLLMPDMAQAQDGFQPVPDAPGFGWTPDEDALARCRLS